MIIKFATLKFEYILKKENLTKGPIHLAVILMLPFFLSF